MDHSANPYYQPSESGKDPTARYPRKLADALARMKEQLCPGATHWAYVAAYARRGDFCIDVAHLEAWQAVEKKRGSAIGPIGSTA